MISTYSTYMYFFVIFIAVRFSCPPLLIGTWVFAFGVAVGFVVFRYVFVALLW